MLSERRGRSPVQRWTWEAAKLIVASLATTLLASQILLTRLEERAAVLQRDNGRIEQDLKELRTELRELRTMILKHDGRETK